MASIRHAEPVMGTVVSFVLHGGDLDEPALHAALARACAGLHQDDATFSTWRADSPMSRVRRGELALRDAPPEIVEVLIACTAARELSGGWFDPWSMPGGVDPTGLVKGWAAQRAAEVLRGRGVSAGMVNAAGDIACFGRPEAGRGWKIGVVDPSNPEAIARTFEVESSIATSGTYERGEHIFDPFAGTRRVRAASATVIGPDLGLADALATALVAEGGAGLKRIAALPGYRAYLQAPLSGQRGSI
jgi:thiamine biosynthesis lipoprotein